jgi:hypothetical protein
MLERMYRVFPKGAWPGPATPAALARVESRLGIAIPEPLRALLSQHDGTPGHSGMDHGWIRVWSISEWSNPVHEAHPTRRFVGLAFFADWGISSDEYYLDGVRQSATYGHIFVGEVVARRQIAESFSQFLTYMLEGNTRALW